MLVLLCFINVVSDPPCRRNPAPPRPITVGCLIRKGGARKAPEAQSLPQSKEQKMYSAAPKATTPAKKAETRIAAPPVKNKPIVQKSEPTPVIPVIKVKSDEEAVVTKKAVKAPPKRAPPSIKKEPSLPRFKALYDFTGEEEGEVNLKVDDIVKVKSMENNGWWLAQHSDGREGWVPSDYLEEVKAPEIVAPKKPARAIPTPKASMNEDYNKPIPRSESPMPYDSQENVEQVKVEVAKQEKAPVSNLKLITLGETAKATLYIKDRWRLC